MKLAMNQFLVQFLQMLSEIDETSVSQISNDTTARGRRAPGDGSIRIQIASSEVQRAMRGYFPRETVRIIMVLPPARMLDDLFKFSRLGAYDSRGGEVGPVIPLTVLSEELVAALQADVRHQLGEFGAGPPVRAGKPA